jgi:hypothetical protein
MLSKQVLIGIVDFWILIKTNSLLKDLHRIFSIKLDTTYAANINIK